MADALAEAAKQIAALQKQVRKLQARNTPSVYMGWTNIPVQPTYVSATSILFTGIDLTAHLKSYIKCRWYQSGWKYGYVSSSSLGSGNTTATLVTNTSYTVANAAITNFSISYGNPVDFPEYFNFDLVPVGWSGTPTTTAYFRMDGRMATCFIRVSGTSNATTASGTAPIAASDYAYGFFRSTNNGINQSALGMAAIGAGSTITFSLDATGTAWTASGTKAIGRLCLQYMC
jgi:hypothetical protein